MYKIVFIIPSFPSVHINNRILEFVDRKYDVEVYSFVRGNQKEIFGLPFKFHLLGTLQNEKYVKRLPRYIVQFKRLGKRYKGEDVIFYLCGLDIAMSFHYLNPSFLFIYEECDLVHTYLGRIKVPLEWIDKKIIKKSLITVTTSAGFIEYHFGGMSPENVVLIENKLNPEVLKYEVKEKIFDKNKLSIGFVGVPRFSSVCNFVDVFCKNFPQGTFHIYGAPIADEFLSLKMYPNCVFHGPFHNPTDLPTIYGNIDVVVATYDVKSDNVRYAEPNKLYESIYFETPIIVSSGTYLAEKVKRLGIGYCINSMNDVEVINFAQSLSEESLNVKIKNIKTINKEEVINNSDYFFEKLSHLTLSAI